MAITPAPDYPSRATDTQADFSAKVEAFLAWESDFADELNAASTTYLLGVSGTSVTSNSIGTGAKTWTTQTGLGFVVGQTLRIANSGTNYVTGQVTSYTTGTGALVMNITDSAGSGTYTSWTISLGATGASAAGDISFTPAGNIASSNVQSAIEELDSEKLSSAAGAVTGTNLEDIITGATVGSASSIPVITYDANGRITSTSSALKVTTGTINSSTSVTERDFTGISANAKIIHIGFISFSTNGTSLPIIQLGDAGGFETSGYSGAVWQTNTSNTNHSTGFYIASTGAATSIYHGHLTLVLIDPSTNTWSISGSLSLSNSASQFTISGTKALSGTLDRIRITATNGTDQIDGGSNNIVIL